MHFGEAGPSPFQRNHLNIGRKFVLSAGGGSSKRDLSLTLAGMPKPCAFVPGKFKIDGVVLPPADQWHTRFTPAKDNFSMSISRLFFSFLPSIY
jgi:hypothetical protein